MSDEPVKKGHSFLYGFLVALFLCGLTFLALTSFAGKENRIKRLIHSKAINEVSDEDIDNGKYHGMVEALNDKYAAYFDRAEYDQLNTTNSGAYKGLGIVFITQEDPKQIIVAEVYEESPAAESGIMAGDIVVSADGVLAEDLEINDIVESIKNGAKEVVFVMKREGVKDPLEFTVIPGAVNVPTVKYQLLDGDVAYIAISNFRKSTEEQFAKAYESMKNDSAKALIIDLRDNGGGLVSSVIDVMNDFVPEGLLVYTEEKGGSGKEYKSECKDPIDIPVAVLVNSATASSAEIMAGAIRDREVGILVGSKTFGKGIVQTIYPLDDGTAVRLTTATYFTPNGTSLNGTGLEPDIETDTSYPEGEYSLEKDETVLAALDAIT